MFAESWDIFTSEYEGQLLAQMSALVDDARLTTEQERTEARAPNLNRKHVCIFSRP